jgi:hypothetical protein
MVKRARFQHGRGNWMQLSANTLYVCTSIMYCVRMYVLCTYVYITGFVLFLFTYSSLSECSASEFVMMFGKLL